jgi:hypothetical protein
MKNTRVELQDITWVEKNWGRFGKITFILKNSGGVLTYARQLGLYVKTTRTVLLFYNIDQYLYVYNYLFI